MGETRAEDEYGGAKRMLVQGNGGSAGKRGKRRLTELIDRKVSEYVASGWRKKKKTHRSFFRALKKKEKLQ